MRIRNTNCFSTGTIVTRTRLSVTPYVYFLLVNYPQTQPRQKSYKTLPSTFSTNLVIMTSIMSFRTSSNLSPRLKNSPSYSQFLSYNPVAAIHTFLIVTASKLSNQFTKSNITMCVCIYICMCVCVYIYIYTRHTKTWNMYNTHITPILVLCSTFNVTLNTYYSITCTPLATKP
jgi:hypothetical protein